MLKWQKNFLTGETVKKPEKIKKKLDAGKFVYDIYLLTLSDNPDNLMDIIPAAMLLQKSFYGICPKIIGMANGKDEALEMVRSLIEEIYTGNRHLSGGRISRKQVSICYIFYG